MLSDPRVALHLTQHRGGFGRVYRPDQDVRSNFASEEDFAKRLNLFFFDTDGYNYDRPRKEGEGKDWGDKTPSQKTGLAAHGKHL